MKFIINQVGNLRLLNPKIQELIVMLNIQNQVIQEMKHQGADKQTINWALGWLKTPMQLQKMMNYLISIREMHIPKGKVIDMIDKIAED